MDSLRLESISVIDANKEELQQLSFEIWKNPELNFEEHLAHELLTNFLERKGFTVERGYCGIKTAFKAVFGSGKPNVCVICEYDALPDIGHACGHNLIAEAGIATGLGVKAFLEAQESGKGTITVMGTPAEEGGGGKVYLIERNAFDNVDVVVMAHPAPVEVIMPSHLACQQMEAHFTGKAAHAAAFPWEGVNALDAGVLAYSNVSVLRQQMKPKWRVHGVFTNGGAKPNIIPEKCSLKYYVRAPTHSELDILKKKVVACFEAAGQATGCTVEVKCVGKLYENIICNPVLGKIYEHNYVDLGVTDYVYRDDLTASTDIGNVSQVYPTIQPRYRVGNGEATHSAPFATIANMSESHSKTLLVAKSLALTLIDVLTGGESLVKEIKDAFIQQKKEQKE